MDDINTLAYKPKEFARATSISVNALCRDRKDGSLGGIPFVKLGNRVVYPKQLVEEWFAKRAFNGESISFVSSLNDKVSVRRPRGRPKGTTKVRQSQSNLKLFGKVNPNEF